MIRAGTCAFQDHASFYPRTLPPLQRLQYYSKFFSVVEIDSTYYGFLREGTWQRWLSLVPKNFIFHVKAHGAMTMHVKNISKQERIDIVHRFLEDLKPVQESGQLGVVLLQFPPWFHATRVNRLTVERVVELCKDVSVGIEFRERTWFEDDRRTNQTLAWLQDMNAVHVVCDEPQVGTKTVPLVPRVTNRQLSLFRMHGRNAETWDKPGLKSSKERFNYRYTRAELGELLPSVHSIADESDEVHILMNNNSNNDAVSNGFDWMELLNITHPPRPSVLDEHQLPLL